MECARTEVEIDGKVVEPIANGFPTLALVPELVPIIEISAAAMTTKVNLFMRRH
jgi:hypothetical protein